METGWIAAIDWKVVALSVAIWVVLCYYSALGVDYIRTCSDEYDRYEDCFVTSYRHQPFTRRDWVWIPFGPVGPSSRSC